MWGSRYWGKYWQYGELAALIYLCCSSCLENFDWCLTLLRAVKNRDIYKDVEPWGGTYRMSGVYSSARRGKKRLMLYVGAIPVSKSSSNFWSKTRRRLVEVEQILPHKDILRPSVQDIQSTFGAISPCRMILHVYLLKINITCISARLEQRERVLWNYRLRSHSTCFKRATKMLLLLRSISTREAETPIQVGVSAQTVWRTWMTRSLEFKMTALFIIKSMITTVLCNAHIVPLRSHTNYVWYCSVILVPANSNSQSSILLLRSVTGNFESRTWRDSCHLRCTLPLNKDISICAQTTGLRSRHVTF